MITLMSRFHTNNYCISCLQGFQNNTLIKKKARRIYGLMQTVKLNLKLEYMLKKRTRLQGRLYNTRTVDAMKRGRET